MTLLNIFKRLKPIMIKGAKVKDLLHDIEATSWEYVYQCLKDERALLNNGEMSMDQYNDIFLTNYNVILKVLKKAKGK